MEASEWLEWDPGDQAERHLPLGRGRIHARKMAKMVLAVLVEDTVARPVVNLALPRHQKAVDERDRFES